MPEAPRLVTTSEISSDVKSLGIMKARSSFLAAAKGRKAATLSLILQARARRPDETAIEPGARIGYTCSKKVGNAVARNRAKRRLRAAAQAVLRPLARPGWDYVLIGLKHETAARPFEALLADLRHAADRVHAPARAGSEKREPNL